LHILILRPPLPFLSSVHPTRRNIQCLSSKRPPVFQRLLDWCQQQQQQACDLHRIVADLTQPQLAAALALLRAEAPAASQHDGSGGGGSGQADAMVVVVLTEAAETEAAAATPAVGASSGQTPSKPPLSVTVFCKWLPAPQEPHKDRVVDVIARGGPRLWPHAKHCEWVLQRRGLDAFKASEGAAEVVLVDEGGGWLEGLVTNFFVVAEVGPAPSAQSTAATAAAASTAPAAAADHETPPVDLSRYELQTAAGANQLVLQGIMQRRVIEAAESLGLRVRVTPPRGDERATWREAFIANCIKGLEPVGVAAYWPGAFAGRFW
jgi:hypothetical protein